MYLPEEEWKFINTFAPWFSAIGTFLAVITSLCIAFSARKISLSISSDIYEFNEGEEVIDYLAIFVTNTGYRTIYLNNLACISFQLGLFKKVNIGIGYNSIDGNKSSVFPCKLGENETAELFIKINNENKNWLHSFKNEYLKKNWLSTLKIIVYPNAGKSFKEKPGKTIIKVLKSI